MSGYDLAASWPFLLDTGEPWSTWIMYGQPYGYAAGYAPSVTAAMSPYASGAARGGALVELRQWTRSNPDFLAWARAQGSGWVGLLESVGTPPPTPVPLGAMGPPPDDWTRPWISPDHWRELARAYSVQMNYMGQRWPNGMALLNAALAEWAATTQGGSPAPMPRPGPACGHSGLPPCQYGTGQVTPPAQEWASPAKQQFFSLPPAQREVVKAANLAMHKAVKDLLAQGVAPRWILQTANRFVAMEHGGGTEPPIYTSWDAQAPSEVPPDLSYVWNGAAWVQQPHATGYWPV